jgi:signal peptidase I
MNSTTNALSKPSSMKSALLSAAKPTRLRRLWLTWRWYVFFVFGVWIPVRSAIADYNPVPTGSMNPTIVEGDVVYINKLAYGLRVPLTLHRLATWAEPQRGDIVVVFSPLDGTRLVKRVVGIPGDTIAMTNDQLTINGTALAYAPPRADYGAIIPSESRPYAAFAEENLTGIEHAVMAMPRLAVPQRNFDPVIVPAGKYFVMGDNRDNSFDSRFFGFADRDAIIGKATAVIVSWDIKDTWLPRMDRFFARLR